MPFQTSAGMKESQTLNEEFYKLNDRLIKHFIIQLMRNIYVDKNKIIKYLKVLQHVSDHRGSIIKEPCTVLG